MQKNDSVDLCIMRAKDKSDPYRLMGFGHRVYQTKDPRSELTKNLCIELFNKLGFKDSLFDLAVE